MDFTDRPLQAPLGGVMTRQVGAVSGPLIVRFRGEDDGLVCVEVAYEGTDEFYTVSGSPLPARAHLADEILAHLASDAGIDADDNPLSTSLKAMKKSAPRPKARAESTHETSTQAPVAQPPKSPAS